MANRIYDSVIAVDSAMGNLPIVGGTSSNINGFNVIGISFTATNTAGNCIITAANTLDIIVQFNMFATVIGSDGIINAQDSIAFSEPLKMGVIKCPTLTAGSARVYLA